VKESDIKRSENNKTGSFPDDQRIQTLCDFVDEESIEEIT